MKLEVKTLVDIPIEEILSYSHDNDAAADISFVRNVRVKPGYNEIPLGFTMKLPPGLAGYIFPRSSMMAKGIQFNLAPVDPDYSNEWHLICFNSTDAIHEFDKGSRVCQIVFMPFIQVNFAETYSNRRSLGGIGSTGV